MLSQRAQHRKKTSTVSYYGYHQKIKQRIAAGELTGFEYVDQYKQIKPCLLLYFSTDPMVRPIRESKFPMYEELLHVSNNSLKTS